MGTVPCGGCAGHANRAVEQTRPAGAERIATSPPLGRGQAPLGSGRRALSLAPAHSHWLAWHQRTSMAPVQAMCLPRPSMLV